MKNYHEPVNELRPETRDYTRALNSFKEELEAIDWYQQRIDAAGDEYQEYEKLRLFLLESFTFMIADPGATIVLE